MYYMVRDLSVLRCGVAADAYQWFGMAAISAGRVRRAGRPHHDLHRQPADAGARRQGQELVEHVRYPHLRGDMSAQAA